MAKVTALLLISLVCSAAAAFDVPPECREPNWGPEHSRNWSCVHAVVVTDLRYLGYAKAAEQWRQTHSGAENDSMLARDCEQAGVKIEQIFDKSNIAFLETNCRKAYGCGVQITTPQQLHEIFLTQIDPYWVTYIDPNHPDEMRMATQEFLHRWTGWAFVIYGVQRAG